MKESSLPVEVNRSPPARTSELIAAVRLTRRHPRRPRRSFVSHGDATGTAARPCRRPRCRPCRSRDGTRSRCRTRAAISVIRGAHAGRLERAISVAARPRSPTGRCGAAKRSAVGAPLVASFRLPSATGYPLRRSRASASPSPAARRASERVQLEFRPALLHPPLSRRRT